MSRSVDPGAGPIRRVRPCSGGWPVAAGVLLAVAVAVMPAFAEYNWSNIIDNTHGGVVECSGVKVQYSVPVLEHTNLNSPDELSLRLINLTGTAKWVVFDCGVILSDGSYTGGTRDYGVNGLKPYETRVILEKASTRDSEALHYKKDASGAFDLNSDPASVTYEEFYYLEIGYLAVLDLPLPAEKEPVNEGSTNFYMASAGRYYSPTTDGVRCNFGDIRVQVRDFPLAQFGPKPVDTNDFVPRVITFPGPSGAGTNPPGTGTFNQTPSPAPSPSSAPDLTSLAQSFNAAMDKGLDKVDAQSPDNSAGQDAAKQAADQFLQDSSRVDRSLQSALGQTTRLQGSFQSIRNQLSGAASSGGPAGSGGVSLPQPGSALNNQAGAGGFSSPPPKFPPPQTLAESYQQAAAYYQWAAQQYRAQGNNAKAVECEQMAEQSLQEARALQGSPGQALSPGR